MAIIATPPEDLLAYADAHQDESSQWVCLVQGEGASRWYRWDLHPKQQFGRDSMIRWLGRLAARHDYPLRLSWRGSNGELHAYYDYWGPDNEAEEGGLAPSMLPSELSAPQIDEDANNPWERGFKLVMEQPEIVAASLATIFAPFRRDAAADALLRKQCAADSAQAAAMASSAIMEQTLARIAADAGYEHDDDGRVIPYDDEADELADLRDQVAEAEARIAELTANVVDVETDDPDLVPFEFTTVGDVLADELDALDARRAADLAAAESEGIPTPDEDPAAYDRWHAEYMKRDQETTCQA